MAGLNAKQKMFCEEYLIDLNATQTAIRSGYSEKTAYSQGQRLLKHVEVQEYIQELKEKRAERTEITADRVLAELGKIGFQDVRNLFSNQGSLKAIHDLDDFTAGSVASIEVVTVPSGEYDDDGNKEFHDVHKIKTWDKKAALVDIGKHLGMFPNKHEHTGKDGGPIQVEQKTEGDLIEQAKRLGIDPAILGLAGDPQKDN